ncbi:Uncharacterized protein Rs2_44018 [Raphanus sativus]|nr:Uncharacterized protein Rs2_44018 [Raphanus sativus]
MLEKEALNGEPPFRRSQNRWRQETSTPDLSTYHSLVCAPEKRGTHFRLRLGLSRQRSRDAKTKKQQWGSRRTVVVVRSRHGLVGGGNRQLLVLFGLLKQVDQILKLGFDG